MRRAIAAIDGEPIEIRCATSRRWARWSNATSRSRPGTQLTIDIVGVGPVVGTVRWAQASRFGLQFNEHFDLARLAPTREKLNDVTMLQPWYVDHAGESRQLGR